MNFSFPKINKIEIIGLNPNERKKIESIINDANFKNIFNLDKQYLKEKIDSINSIEHFEIFKNYPSTLKIFIKETKILAQTKKKSSNYFIGSNGKLILTDYSSSSLPFVFGDLNVEEFIKFKNEVDKSNFDFKKIVKLYYFKSKRWDIETSEGYLIKLSRNDVEKDLNLFVRISNEDKLKNELVIDFRQKDQIILNGK
ncbi:FtsQ-type POTRA domain-containing protein [Candidatus Pelagibacter sp.]|nr:FtsQ-type POTRA domain-containing protein [Candidatus Pelagibacter sp.]